MVSKKEEKRPDIPFKLSDCVVSTEQQQSEQFKALNDFMNSDKNIKQKTEINKPFTFAVATTYSDFVNDCGFDDSAQDIKHFLSEYEQFAISKKRNGRKEFVEMYRNLNQALKTDENKTEVIRKP